METANTAGGPKRRSAVHPTTRMNGRSTRTKPARRRVRVLDGAYAPLLRAAGFDPTRPLAEAVLTKPQLVVEAHARFVEAGAELIVTLTGAANRPALTRFGLADRLRRINADAVALARRAAARNTMLFGAIGPSHLLLALDEATPADLTQAFREQAEVLLDAGVDGIVIEGMSDLAEAVAAIEAVRQLGTTPLSACMTFQTRGNAFATADQVSPKEAATALEGVGADWVGCHGGLALTESLPLVESLAAATTRPLWVRLDVAQPEYEDKKLVYRQPPEEFAAVAPKLVALRVEVIGGLSGASPEHVAALSGALAPRR